MWYSDRNVADIIKMLPEYLISDWVGLKNAVKKEWKKADVDQILHIRRFLEVMRDWSRKNSEKVRNYYRYYTAVLRNLVRTR